MIYWESYYCIKQRRCLGLSPGWYLQSNWTHIQGESRKKTIQNNNNFSQCLLLLGRSNFYNFLTYSWISELKRRRSLKMPMLNYHQVSLDLRNRESQRDRFLLSFDLDNDNQLSTKQEISEFKRRHSLRMPMMNYHQVRPDLRNTSLIASSGYTIQT